MSLDQGRIYRAAAVAVVLVYLALAWVHGMTLAPFCDEGWFAEPAWNLMTRGVMANTVLDPTASFRGIRLDGIQKHTYWVMPFYMLAQAAWYQAVGFGLFSMRALSILCGLAGLAAWYWTMRAVSEDRAAALATMALLSVDFAYNWSAAAGRMDAMCVALGSWGVALYLLLRQRFYLRAVIASNVLVAAALFTHPNALLFFLDLVFLTLYLDTRRILHYKALAWAAAPYLAGLAGWGLYIAKAPDLFRAQFFSNAGNPADRLLILRHPLTALLREITDRYLRHFGLAAYSHGFSRTKLLVLGAYGIAAVVFFVSGRFRRQGGYRALMGIALVHLAGLCVLDGFKSPLYLIYVIPVLAAMCAAVAVAWWRTRTAPRFVLAAVMGAVVAVNTATIVQRARPNAYRNEYLAAAEFMKTHAEPAQAITASAEMGFELGFTPRLTDDYRLGYYSGKQSDFIMVDGARYGAWIPLLAQQDPGNYEYIQKLLANDYRVIYDRQGYKIYQRVRAGATSQRAFAAVKLVNP